MDTRLNDFLAQGQQRVEAALEQWLPAATSQPQKLHEAMRYSTVGGGKRIRPALVYAVAQSIGIEPDRVDAPACAIELIHAYSLIHDDLPAMDDDDLRRGRPTCHKAFDEATAILAGDALQGLAFQVLAADRAMDVRPEARVAMIETLARAAGSRGMCGGQALDLDAEGKELDLVMLENIHIHKTGALIRAGVRMAALAHPGLETEQADRLDHYAKCLGLAFQVHDDILDVEGDTEVTGKQQGKDAARAKTTYPSLLGLTDARATARDLVDQAMTALEPFDEQADPLRWIAGFMVDRDH